MSTQPVPGPPPEYEPSGWRPSRDILCAVCRVRLAEHVAAHVFRVPRRPL